MIKEYIIQMVMDHIVKDKILPAREEKLLRDKLEVYLEEQIKINELCLRNEEIDFDGLANYIRKDLFDDIDKYLVANWRKRDSIKAAIVSKAVSYAQANTSMSRKHAVEFTEAAMNLLYHYKRSKIDKDLQLITAEIQECIEETVERNAEKQIDNLARVSVEMTRELANTINSNNPMSIDRNVGLLQTGNIELVEMNIQNVFKAISSAHSLFPDYGYGYNGKLYSRPFTSANGDTQRSLLRS